MGFNKPYWPFLARLLTYGQERRQKFLLLQASRTVFSNGRKMRHCLNRVDTSACPRGIWDSGFEHADPHVPMRDLRVWSLFLIKALTLR